MKPFFVQYDLYTTKSEHFVSWAMVVRGLKTEFLSGTFHRTTIYALIILVSILYSNKIKWLKVRCSVSEREREREMNFNVLKFLQPILSVTRIKEREGTNYLLNSNKLCFCMHYNEKLTLILQPKGNYTF